MNSHVDEPADLLQPVRMHVDRAAIMAYADLTGDYNPIHVDETFAASTAMGGVIAHGTLSLNLVWQALARTLGPAAAEGASLDVRFVRPVRQGTVVEAGGRRDPASPRRYDVWVRAVDGDVVIQGTLTLAGEDRGSPRHP